VQRGLAGPIGTDDGMELAFLHIELDVVRGDNALESFAYSFELRQRVRHSLSFDRKGNERDAAFF
jgi:hypothetical protein